MLIVHFLLNMLSLANASGHLGGCIDMHSHLITVILLDEIGTGFNAKQFALNYYMGAFQGQNQDQYEPTRQDTDDFRDRYHGGASSVRDEHRIG